MIKSIQQFIFVGLLCSLLLACEKPAETNSKLAAQSNSENITEIGTQQASETERLNAWFEEKYEAELMESPLGLTMQGRQERYGELDDFSEEAYARQVSDKLKTVDEMKATFSYEALTDDAKLSWDLWEYQAQQEKARFDFRNKNFIFHQMSGMHSFLPTFLISFHKVKTLADMQAYISRINATGRALKQLVDAASQNAKEVGTRPPRFAYEIVSDQAHKILAGRPFDNSDSDAPLLVDAKSKLAALLEDEAIDQKQSDALLTEVEQAMLNGLQPGYKTLIGFLDDDVVNSSEQAQGVGALANGEDYYNHQLKMMTTTDMTAEEIHQLGLSEVDRLRAEMEILKAKSGFAGTLIEFFSVLRDSKTDDRFYFETTAEGAQGYIDDATTAIENIKAVLPDYFGILPKADLVVKRVESFREQDGAPQHYFSGTPDGSRPGIYYAHLSDMGAMPKFMLEVIAYHEGLPGHHMQISIAQELEAVPTFRTQAGFTAYSEGWGLYSEILAKEMKDTYTDVYSDFGRLNSEMWRAVRLVVDTGLHAKGWSQQQAVDFFKANSPTPLPAIEAEVRRYLVMPGQATSYKIGMIEIQRLRKMAETELGDTFDIRTFHDVILGGGALPLSLLERQVKKWIAETRPAKAA